MSKKLILIGVGVIILALAGVLVLSRLSTTEEKNGGGTKTETIAEIDTKVPRSYRMGFSLIHPPLKNEADYKKRLDIWSGRADGSITHQDVPWKQLLAGASPEDIINSELLPQIKLLRSKNLDIIITVEPLNGVDRESEAEELVKAGRSISETKIQELYHGYVIALAKVVKPNYLGLAAEVNLLKRLVAPETYEALRKMVNNAASDLKKENRDILLYVSVQVDEAWNASGGSWNKAKSYLGLGTFYNDYPFLNAVGLSSYPHIGWKRPEDIPMDYFTKILEGHSLPLLVTESGWASKFSHIKSSEEMQARWIRKLGELADFAHAVFISQILFSDFQSWIPTEGALEEGALEEGLLELFATQGLVDGDFNPKPALEVWDKIFSRKYQPIK